MRSRRACNLTLNAHCRRRKKKTRNRINLACVTLTNELYTVSKPKTRTFNTPASNRNKRQLHKSPYKLWSPASNKKTPSKSPLKKRTRKSLIYEYYSEESDRYDIEKVVTDDEFSVIEKECATINLNESNTEINSNTSENIEYLWNEVSEKLNESGIDIVFQDFFRLIKEDRFPLDNIALKLFGDVVTWYSCNNTCQMRYSRDSKIFWKLGYRLFGGRFLHFMGGPKSFGQIDPDVNNKGCLSPLSADINFAVPNDQVLRDFDPYGLSDSLQESVFSPGVLLQMIKTLSKNIRDNSCCLTFDGKKLKQGLGPNMGDVDLFGFENGLTLLQKEQSLENKKSPFNELLIELRQTTDTDIRNISTDLSNRLYMNLKGALKIVSKDIIEIKQLQKKKEYAKQKLIERCETPDWKNSRYVMAISSTIAFLHDIDNYLKTADSALGEIVLCLSCLNKSAENLIKGTEANLQEIDIYLTLMVKALGKSNNGHLPGMNDEREQK